MSKLSDTMNFLRRSTTGQKIVAEIERDDETAKKRVEDATTVADVDLQLADAEREYRKAAASEKKSIEAARQRFIADVAQARAATAAARSRVHLLNRQRDRAASHLRGTADVRIAAFKDSTWQTFQSKRGNVPSIVQETRSKKSHPSTGLPLEDMHTNGPAVTRWTLAIQSAMSAADALALESLDGDEIETRLAALQAEIDEAYANIGEMTHMGERPGDALSAALATAKPTLTTPARPRYQVIEEPAYAG